MDAGHQFMTDGNQNINALWLEEEALARDHSLLLQLILAEFGQSPGMVLVSQLSSSAVVENTLDGRGGVFIVFETPMPLETEPEEAQEGTAQQQEGTDRNVTAGSSEPKASMRWWQIFD